MARVNVDQKALSDPRFDLLARLMGGTDRDLALGRMVRVWNECIERETPTPPRWVIETIFASPEACNWLIESELAENPVHDTDNGTIRIKGTDGRIEWLSKKRRNGKLFGHLGASHGAKGGRPPKTPTPGLSKPVSGDTGNPPPAPAPAPVLKDKGRAPKTFIPPTLEDVRSYCLERRNAVDPEAWVDHYTANGWMVGRSKMKDWRAAIRTWEKNGFQNGKASNSVPDRGFQPPVFLPNAAPMFSAEPEGQP